MSQRAVLKSALAAGEKGIGYWLTIPGPAVVRALTGIGGFNWVLIDGEHGQINDKDFYELSCAVAAAGASPIVRVPNAEEYMVKRALDCGAHGIMTPMCHSAVSTGCPWLLVGAVLSPHFQKDELRVDRLRRMPRRLSPGTNTLPPERVVSVRCLPVTLSVSARASMLRMPTQSVS